MKSFRFVAPLSFSIWFAACGGTETGNPREPGGPLSHFDSSTCKTDSATTTPQSTPGESRQALVAASEYDGLQCIEWERGAKEGDLTVRLLNFPGGCGVAWSGTATRRSDGSLELALVNPSCTVHRCGSCLYDARYDLTGINAGAPLALHIGYVDCPTMGAARWEYDASLPIGDGASGIVCRYAPLNSVLSSKVCSGKNLLCGGASGICGSMPCATGLTCTPVDGANDQRCLQPCMMDADCSPAGIMACTEGTCRVAKPW